MADGARGWSRHGRRAWGTAGQALVAVLVVLLVGVPLVELFSTALEEGADAARRTLIGRGTGRAVYNTVLTSLAITLLAVAGGVTAAFITERSAAPGRRFLRTVLVASLLAAPLVSALGWARAYGPAGLLDKATGVQWDGLYGAVGIIVVTAAGALPLAYLVVAASLSSRGEPDLDRAARASGAAPRVVLRTVTLPLAGPAVGAAAGLVFVSGVNSFEVPAVLGIPAGFPTMTTRLYENLTLSADPRAFTAATVLAAALVVLAVVVVGPLDTLTGSGRARRTAASGGAPSTVGRSSWGLAVGLWCVLVLTTVVPLVALVLVALTRAAGLAPVPANWTLANFSLALEGRALVGLGNSVVLGCTAATAVLLLGGLTAVVARGAAGGALSTVITLSFAVAGSALAVAVLLAYGPLLRDTLAIILVAYVAKFWALGHRPIAGAADRLPADLVRAARSAGAGPLSAASTVVLPLLRPALVVAWLLVFLFCVHELTISSLLYGPGNETLAVVILNQQELGNVGVTSALSVLLTGVIGAAGLLLVLARRQLERRAA